MNSLFFWPWGIHILCEKWQNDFLHWFLSWKNEAKYYYNVILSVKECLPYFSWSKLCLWLALLFARPLILKNYLTIFWKMMNHRMGHESGPGKINQLAFQNFWDGTSWGITYNVNIKCQLQLSIGRYLPGSQH